MIISHRLEAQWRETDRELRAEATDARARRRSGAVAVAVPSSTPADPTAPAATPLVRKLAASAGVDLATVKGTGAAGRVTAHDVRAAAQEHSDAATEASWRAFMAQYFPEVDLDA